VLPETPILHEGESLGVGRGEWGTPPRKNRVEHLVTGNFRKAIGTFSWWGWEKKGGRYWRGGRPK